MDRFHIIDDAAVILRSRGVYRQAKVYRRGDDLYAGSGAGFVRLHVRGGTSAPNISWDDIDLAGAGASVSDGVGRMVLVAPVYGKQIEGSPGK